MLCVLYAVGGTISIQTGGWEWRNISRQWSLWRFLQRPRRSDCQKAQHYMWVYRFLMNNSWLSNFSYHFHAHFRFRWITNREGQHVRSRESKFAWWLGRNGWWTHSPGNLHFRCIKNEWVIESILKTSYHAWATFLCLYWTCCCILQLHNTVTVTLLSHLPIFTPPSILDTGITDTRKHLA
jgi:hypothetical protein